MFITFEGCDGSGKSTQIRFAAEYLTERGFDIVLTREPGGTKISEKLRAMILDPTLEEMDPVTEATLYAAARVQHVKELIIPAVEAGKVVLCDRYLDSSLAYQGVARGLGFDLVKNLFDLTCGVQPNVTFWLDVPSDRAFRRKGGIDQGDRMESAGVDFHRMVYDGYEQALAAYPERIRRIDASGSKYETRDKVRAELSRLFSVK